MRISKALIPAALLLAVAGAAFAQSNLPNNSYLDKRVNSTAELVQHVKTDSVVMDRYRRHFAMSSDEVVQYLSSLRISKLPKDGVYTVYGVPHSTGDFHAHLRTLKQGEPVFVEADGTPVLQVVCGNPLILGPKKPGTPNPIAATTGEPNGPKEYTVEAETAPTAGPISSEMPRVEDAPQPIAPHGGSVVPLLLGLAGSIGFFHGGHGHPPVPEPFSIMVMAGGLSALAARRRLKKKIA